MLTVKFSDGHRFCDGVSRRSFLQIGALGIGALSLPDLLRAESSKGIRTSHKAVINIHLQGGPSHQDMFDLKPDAPVEFRGEFNPISTNVPGLDICEHFPKLATMADKFAVIRSLVGSNAGHSNFQTHTGFNQKSMANMGGRPSIGSVVGKLQGSSPSGAPPFVSYNGGSYGYLGPVHAAFSPTEAKKVLKLNSELSEKRLSERTSLLSSLDTIRRDIDSRGQLEALDSYTQRAYMMVTSGEVARALDVEREKAEVIRRYGRSSESVLIARRLIQAGVRVVTLSTWGGWDTHSNNFTTLKKNLTSMDTGLSALLWDLERLDMLKDVSVVVWGEFGRTPRVNKSAGRDHWPKLSMAWMAGGGMKTGQAIGSSTRYAEEARDRPLDFQEVHATLYHNLGIDPRSTTIIDSAGRPQYLLEKRNPIAELV